MPTLSIMPFVVYYMGDSGGRGLPLLKLSNTKEVEIYDTNRFIWSMEMPTRKRNKR